MTAADLKRRARELLGLEIQTERAAVLVHFAELVKAWADRMNLVAARSTDEILSRHVLDSLAAAPLLTAARRVVDVGSGAGFPGVPLAIAMPELHVELVESRRKRASFLRHVVRTLALANVVVHEMRAEDWRSEGTVEATIGRAVSSEILAEVSRGMLAPGGRMVLMKKEGAEVPTLPDFERERTRRYRLPDGERHELIAFGRRST